MVLFMPRPYKHPATGVYWYRQRVPAKLKSVARGQTASITVHRAVFRRTIGNELVVSLATKETHEAKQRAVQVQTQFDALWAALANPPTKLTLKEIVALAGEAFRAFQAMEDDPGRPELWRNILKTNNAAFAGTLPTLHIGPPEQRYLAGLKQRFGAFVDGVLQKHHLGVDDETYRQLLVHFGRALTAAAELLLKRSEGDYSPDTRGERYPRPPAGIGKRNAKAAIGLSLFDLLDHKDKTRTLKAKTISDYRRLLQEFAKFVGHDDARRLTKDDVRRWRDKLISEVGAPKKTVNDRYLASIKSVLNHGVKEFDLPSNVADNIRDERDNPAPKGAKDYTLDQAKTILGATFRGPSKNVSVPYRRALFWVPWLCAYTGARVTEITQLQANRLVWHDGVPCLMVTPQDGSTKGGKAWLLGIHQHLIDLGLLDMIKAVGQGPLFYAPYPEGTDLAKLTRHRASDSANRVTDWIKEILGTAAPLGRPNHAWRHTFTTQSRVGDMDKEARDFMMGSRPTTDAREGYGEWPPVVLSREINKLPKFVVEESSWRPSNDRVPVTLIRGTTPTKRVRRQPNRRNQPSVASN